MELQALLFTTDRGSAATLCEVLTELGIHAEICSQMLVASERIGREPYDAIVVDWDNEVEAAFLLKKAREQRVFSLNLALVPDEATIARALQQGANSVIRKPVDIAQASDTLATARDLILSRHTEQREKQARLTALEAEAEPLEDAPIQELPAPKSGFLQQSMTRTAFEAEQKITRRQSQRESGWQAARGPASMQNAEAGVREPEPITKKRWDEVKTIFREDADASRGQKPDTGSAHSEDSAGVFSSFTEPDGVTQTLGDIGTSSPPQYVVFAVVACVLIAGVLYVWAPGDSYLGRMTSAFHAFSVKAKATTEKPTAAPAPPSPEKPTPVLAASKPEDLLMADPPAVSTDVDPNNIRIIETKNIPKAGAQQPPSNEPPPDSDQARALTQGASDGASSEATAAVQDLRATAAPQRPPVASPPPVPKRVPEDTMPSTEERTGVVIPDSLRTTPAPSPASSLEPFTISEATAQALLIHRVEPQYPAQALGQHLDGAVVLQAWVGRDGVVRDVKLVRGYFVLGRAAFDAVKQWRYKPILQDGRAIDFQTSITLNFQHPN